MSNNSEEKYIYTPSGKELDMAFSGPTLVSNRFYVTLAPQGFRIAFTEQIDAARMPVFRTAVMLSHEDGVALYEILKELVKKEEALLVQSRNIAR